MVHTKFIEYGRLVQIQGGEHKGKFAVITNILDIKQLQVQGPEVPRCIIATNFVALCSQVHATKTAIVKTEAEKIAKDLIAEYNKSAEGKKLHAATVRANLNDFQRYTALSLCAQRDKKIHEICKKNHKSK